MQIINKLNENEKATLMPVKQASALPLPPYNSWLSLETYLKCPVSPIPGPQSPAGHCCMIRLYYIILNIQIIWVKPLDPSA